MANNIHQGQPRLTVGAENGNASQVVILLHGRGATAESMLPVAEALSMPELHFVIPQAGLNRWYPATAFGPLDANEPDLSFALETVDTLVTQARDDGFSDEQIFFGGFSQGACLAVEYVVRNARRYGGLFVLSGALIGPPGQERHNPGDLAGMPVLIGGSDADPWVAHAFMVNTAQVLERMGAAVEHRTYPGMGHTINQDEIERVRAILAQAQSLQK